MIIKLRAYGITWTFLHPAYGTGGTTQKDRSIYLLYGLVFTMFGSLAAPLSLSFWPIPFRWIYERLCLLRLTRCQQHDCVHGSGRLYWKPVGDICNTISLFIVQIHPLIEKQTRSSTPPNLLYPLRHGPCDSNIFCDSLFDVSSRCDLIRLDANW